MTLRSEAPLRGREVGVEERRVEVLGHQARAQLVGVRDVTPARHELEVRGEPGRARRDAGADRAAVHPARGLDLGMDVVEPDLGLSRRQAIAEPDRAPRDGGHVEGDLGERGRGGARRAALLRGRAHEPEDVERAARVALERDARVGEPRGVPEGRLLELEPEDPLGAADAEVGPPVHRRGRVLHAERDARRERPVPVDGDAGAPRDVELVRARRHAGKEGGAERKVEPRDLDVGRDRLQGRVEVELAPHGEPPERGPGADDERAARAARERAHVVRHGREVDLVAALPVVERDVDLLERDPLDEEPGQVRGRRVRLPATRGEDRLDPVELSVP